MPLRRCLMLAVLLLAILPAAPASAGGGGCHSPGLTEASGTAVDLSGACFSPTVLHVPVGATVTFTNRDDLAHMVNGVAGVFGDDTELWLDDTVSHTFAEPGVIPYFCFLHPSMVGALVVGDGLLPGAPVASVAEGVGDRGMPAAALLIPVGAIALSLGVRRTRRR